MSLLKTIDNMNSMVTPDRSEKKRIREALNYLRINFSDMTEGQRLYFDKVVKSSQVGELSPDQVRFLYNMMQKLKGNKVLIIRNV